MRLYLWTPLSGQWQVAARLDWTRDVGSFRYAPMGMAVWAVHTSWSSTTTTRVPALAQEFDTSMTMALSSLRRLKKR